MIEIGISSSKSISLICCCEPMLNSAIFQIYSAHYYKKECNEFYLIIILAKQVGMLDSLHSQCQLIDSKSEIYRMQMIGRGTFGAVYSGFDKLNNRKVALKYVNNDKEESWQKEIANLELFDHPNIIKCYGYIPLNSQNSETIPKVCIITQFVNGTTLSRYIEKNRKMGYTGLSEDLVYKLFHQLLEGYGHIHNKNFIHRDIKPQNILVDENQNIKIIDFGQSKDRKLVKTFGLGTPLYSAPETFTSKNPPDFRRDVWSLGLVLYEMIAGRFPFEEWKNSSNESAFREHLDKHTFSFKFPKNFSFFWGEICRKMLHKDYKKRINLHQIVFELKKRELQFQLKFSYMKSASPVPKLLMESGSSGNTDLVNQSADQFEITRTRKFLIFFHNKHKFLILLKDHLNKFSYPFLSNAHKLILVFISFNIYIAAIDHLLKRLQKNKLTINDNQQYDASSYVQPYKSQMVNYLELYKQYYVKQCRLTKDYLLQKVIPKFSITEQKQISAQTSSVGSSSSSLKKKTQKYPEVKAIVQNFKEGINFSKAHYLSKFRQLVYSQDYFHSETNIRKYFYQQDLIIYYLMLLIAHLDEQVRWESQKYDGNVLPKLREQFFNVSREEHEMEELIRKILVYTKKNKI